MDKLDPIEKITVHKTLAEIRVDGNDKISPAKMIEWLSNLNTEGWSDLRVSVHGTPFEPYVSGEMIFVVVNGKRLETDKEYLERQKAILSNWKREHNDYKWNFYKNNPIGVKRIEEIAEREELIKQIKNDIECAEEATLREELTKRLKQLKKGKE